MSIGHQALDCTIPPLSLAESKDRFMVKKQQFRDNYQNIVGSYSYMLGHTLSQILKLE